MRRAALLLRCIGVLALGVASLKAQAASHALVLRGQSHCPTPSAFAEALRAILPNVRFLSDDAGAQPIEIVEDGDHYRVRIGSAEQAFAGDTDRCDERARKAAVFVALVLEPPIVDLPPPISPRPAVASLPRRRLAVDLEIAGLFTAAPRRASPSLFAGGGRADLFVGVRNVGGVVGIDATSPVTYSFKTADAVVERVPVTAGLRGRWVRGALALSLDADALLSALVVKGTHTALGIESQRLEPGVRLVAQVTYSVRRRVALFGALHADFVPQSYNLVLASAGIAGTTPQYWLGLAAGVAFGLR